MKVRNSRREVVEIINDIGETTFVPYGIHEVSNLSNKDKLPKGVFPIEAESSEE